MRTFRDVHVIIKRAEGNGGYFVSMDGTDLGMQVYDGRRQVNIGHMDEFRLDSKANHIFEIEEDIVTMYPADAKGYVDYSTGYEIPLDTAIDGAPYPPNGAIIKECLMKFLKADHSDLRIHIHTV